ncbi:pyridoxamine 5'-phosphate oxidase family protein [Aestuariispira insulae]|uniref:Pyridoxamine 5'-phosphate oxidase n=1 Tax=Aestuariispira insulae TaxID=1461337 RepID=A0A3D9HRU5_9PROT|nr:pyridoxamine 5'-phosphate oxidase family protein [Aestuariispira insulae]RED52233.1 pyridoxamine 5'-phosphate oxidase [Aestuariispira insulae]
MAKKPTELRASFIRFIEAQHMFFVATAAPTGRVNLSPKGMDSLKVLSPGRLVWLNLSGSGNETAAHILESDRMTLMFCAFEGMAKIIRVYGQAKTIHPRDDAWEELAGLFPAMAGARQIFDLTIDLVQVSCGTGVPLFDYQGQRGPEELEPFYAKMGPDRVMVYWRRKNQTSVDGRPTGIFDD